MHVHCTLFLDEIPPKSPLAGLFQTPLKLGNPNYPSSRQLQATFPSHKTSGTMELAMNGNGCYPGYHTLNNTQAFFLFNCQLSTISK